MPWIIFLLWSIALLAFEESWRWDPRQMTDVLRLRTATIILELIQYLKTDAEYRLRQDLERRIETGASNWAACKERSSLHSARCYQYQSTFKCRRHSQNQWSNKPFDWSSDNTFNIATLYGMGHRAVKTTAQAVQAPHGVCRDADRRHPAEIGFISLTSNSRMVICPSTERAPRARAAVTDSFGLLADFSIATGGIAWGKQKDAATTTAATKNRAINKGDSRTSISTTTSNETRPVAALRQ